MVGVGNIPDDNRCKCVAYSGSQMILGLLNALTNISEENIELTEEQFFQQNDTIHGFQQFLGGSLSKETEGDISKNLCIQAGRERETDSISNIGVSSIIN